MPHTRESHRAKQREYARRYRERNQERLAAEARERYHANPEPARARRLAYRENCREKVRAHDALNDEIKAGRIVRQPCEKCGAKADAHHDDYSKPIEVRWLCRAHHNQHHASR